MRSGTFSYWWLYGIKKLHSSNLSGPFLERVEVWSSLLDKQDIQRQYQYSEYSAQSAIRHARILWCWDKSCWPVMVNPVWNDSGYPRLASTTPTAACSELNTTSDCDNFPFTHFMKMLNKSLFNSGSITCNTTQQAKIDWVKVICPTRHEIGHFGDVLPSQSLGLALKQAQSYNQLAVSA